MEQRSGRPFKEGLNNVSFFDQQDILRNFEREERSSISPSYAFQLIKIQDG
jgi:hypothetical protein